MAPSAISSSSPQWSSRTLVSVSLFCAIGILLSFIEFPIFPAAPYLKYDASFVAFVLCGFIFGPAAGLSCAFSAILVHSLLMGDLWGGLMSALVLLGFLWPSTLIYQHKQSRRSAALGLICGILASLALAILGNLVITPLYTGMPVSAVAALILPVLLPFNLLKASLNAALALALLTRVSKLAAAGQKAASTSAPTSTGSSEPTPGLAIELQGASYHYPAISGASSGPDALSQLDLSIAPGEFVAIIGANGSGKSSLGKLMNAILSPYEGQVYTLELDTSEPNNLFAIRSQAGMVFQNPADQMLAASVRKDVAFGPENLGVPNPELQERVANALNTVGFRDPAFAYRNSAELSGGQQQRVAIAGALALQPRILILDEASAMLDPRGQRGLMRLVQELHQGGMSIVLISHNMEEVAQAQRVIALQNGRIVAEGKPEEILRRPEVLSSINATPPFALRLSLALQQRGIPVGPHIHLEQLKEELCALNCSN